MTRPDDVSVGRHSRTLAQSTVEGAVSLWGVRRESMQKEAPLPRRFRVGFVAYSERPVTYTVSTWFDELMAVALAANEHASRHPRSPINSVFVEELDSLPSADLKAIPKNEVINLNEWR
jgi:hypothetical protein